ncbi:hypothetical protein KR222_011601, partial [Zaprionus bogoriensis]
CPLTFNTTFTRIGQKYYYISDDKANWFAAAHTCRKLGGDLALIESAEEMHAISAYLIGKAYNNTHFFWISGNDLETISKFMSITNGLPLTYFAWSAGQPDVLGLEQCIHIWLQEGSFKMNNWLCGQRAYFICQRQTHTRCHVSC